MTDEKKVDAPKAQTFNLKPIETQLLGIIHNNQQAIFSAVLSTIANDRLGYQVTQFTQFKLNDQLNTIEISELPPPPEAKTPVAKDGAPAEPAPPQTAPAAPPQPPQEPKSGAVAAS